MEDGKEDVYPATGLRGVQVERDDSIRTYGTSTAVRFELSSTKLLRGSLYIRSFRAPGFSTYRACSVAPFNRVALSPLDHSKSAIAGADGLFRIWRTKQGGKVTPMVPISGLREVRILSFEQYLELVQVITPFPLAVRRTPK